MKENDRITRAAFNVMKAHTVHLKESAGFAMDLTRVVGPIILACAILYAIPGAMRFIL